MQFLASVIGFFSNGNDFLSEEVIDFRRRPPGLLRHVCRGAFLLMPPDKLVDFLPTDFLYPSYGGGASATSVLLYNPTSFFSLSLAIKITKKQEFEPILKL